MAFRQADLERVGQILSKQYGLTVKCQGSMAYTNGRTIVLPTLTEATSESVVTKVRMFLDHEVGHIVGKSDLNLFEEARTNYGWAGQAILNATEDVRVERLMSDIWAGAGLNISGGAKAVLADLDKEAQTTTDEQRKQALLHPLKQFTIAIYALGRYPMPGFVEQRVVDAVSKYKDRLAVIQRDASDSSGIFPLAIDLIQEYKKLRAEENVQSIAEDAADQIGGGVGKQRSNLPPEPGEVPQEQDDTDESNTATPDPVDNGSGPATEPEDAGAADDDGASGDAAQGTDTLEGSNDEQAEVDHDAGLSPDASEQGDDAAGDGDNDGQDEGGDGPDDAGEDDAGPDDAADEVDDGEGGDDITEESDATDAADDESNADDGRDEGDEGDAGDGDEDAGEQGGGDGSSDADAGSDADGAAGTADDGDGDDGLDGAAGAVDSEGPEQGGKLGGTGAAAELDLDSVDMDEMKIDDISKEAAAAIKDAVITQNSADPTETPLAVPGLDKLKPIPLPKMYDRSDRGGEARTQRREFTATKNLMTKMGGAMRQKLVQMLLSEAKVGWRKNLSRGMPDPRKLFKLAARTSDRVMRRPTMDEAVDTACLLLVDGSSSMARQRAMAASLAAATFASALDVAGHACMLCTFQNGDSPDYGEIEKPAEYWNEDGSYNEGPYKAWCERRDKWYQTLVGTRTDGIDLHVAKGFDERFKACFPRIVAMQKLASGGTPMGQAMQFAGRLLAQRLEHRKVMMVFGDGEPNDPHFVTAMCRKLEQAGMEVVLIGIQTSAMRKLWHKTAAVYDLNELAKTTMKELAHALHKA